MVGSLALISLLGALVATPGCKGDGEASPADASPASEVSKAGPKKPQEPKRGVLVLSDRSVKVGPMVAHDPHMDLAVACRRFVDRAKQQGKDIPLCFEARRVEKPTVLRIEHHDGMTGATHMARIRAADEGAHLLIEPSGSIYQILDAAYPARRDGAYREGEIRVLSGNATKQEELRASLAELFPGLEVEIVEIEAPPPKAGGDAGGPGTGKKQE